MAQASQGPARGPGAQSYSALSLACADWVSAFIRVVTMLNIDRHIAIHAGWIAGPALVVANVA
jgi:hypothetical protein